MTIVSETVVRRMLFRGVAVVAAVMPVALLAACASEPPPPPPAPVQAVSPPPPPPAPAPTPVPPARG